MKSLSPKIVKLLRDERNIAAELTPSDPAYRKFIAVSAFRGDGMYIGGKPANYASLPLRYRVSMFEIERTRLDAALYDAIEIDRSKLKNFFSQRVESEEELDALILELVGDSVLFRDRGQTDCFF